VKYLFSLAVFLLAGCERAQEATVTDQSIRPARVFQVSKQGSINKHEFVARVEAAQTVDVSFEVSGPLEQLAVLEGQSVAAGALIAALEPTDFLLAVREAQVQLKLARQDYERKRKLFNERGISRSVVDDAKALFDLRGVHLAQSQEALADTKILAPFDAYVARRFTDSHVNVLAGDKIVRLSDLTELFVVANIPESMAATVTNERLLATNVRFAFLPEQRFAATYREHSGEADAVAQTYQVTFAMPRPEAWNILPGMTATLEVELSAETGAEQSINIPTAALITGPDKKFLVWIYDPQTHEVSKREVQVGPADGRGVTVRSGLTGGELIVATGATQLRQGMKIRVLGEPVTDL
jgi:RND family efflux transporter MFP subunit